MRDRAGFFLKKNLPQKWRKWAKNEPKIGFFGFIGKFRHYFFSEFRLLRKIILFPVFLH